MRSSSPHTHGPLHPLLVKELWEVLSGRAFWIMLLLLCPLVGVSFIEALRLYSEASVAARDSPIVASGLSPLDGIMVPTFGSFYVAVTLLFPFVAIRVLGGEKETGTLRLLVQLPYRLTTLIGIKLVAISMVWLAAAAVAGSALLIWVAIGGHVGGPELANLVLGHLLYGLLVGSIALFAAAISESSASAAIIALAFTIGSWVIDFTAAGGSGGAAWISQVSLTHGLRTFESGLLSESLVAGIVVVAGGFCALATIWLPPGVSARIKFLRSCACVLVVAAALSLAARLPVTTDVTEDQRNSFPLADQRALPRLTEPLSITVRLSPEDPRYVDLRRNVLSKLERTMPNVTVHVADGVLSPRTNASDDRYGEVTYVYGQRSDVSRSTSHREILPLIYGLAGVAAPAPITGAEYPGYPLVAKSELPLFWFFGGLPLLVAVGWRLARRAPKCRDLSMMEDIHAGH